MNIRTYDHSYHEVISGGDVIAAEFSAAWTGLGHTVSVSTHKEAAYIFLSRGTQDASLHIASRIKTNYPNVLIGSIAHLYNGVIDTLLVKQQKADMIFACSWSLQDLLPALIDKLKHPSSTLVVGCYILLPPPWSKLYGSNWLNRLAFWIEYLVGFSLMIVWADVVWTASPVDAKKLIDSWHKRAVAIRGGVDIDAATAASLGHNKKRYDALYIGRFHPQKNVRELVAIWKQVTTHNPDATLIMAGAGFLRNELERDIVRLELTRNIQLLPYIDGQQKFDLISSSKLFVSASHFDTGNLAMDEALACSVPGITYNLPRLVYPQGVRHITPFDTEEFAQTIVYLLTHEQERETLAREANKFAADLDWNIQAARALSCI